MNEKKYQRGHIHDVPLIWLPKQGLSKDDDTNGFCKIKEGKLVGPHQGQRTVSKWDILKVEEMIFFRKSQSIGIYY